LNIKKNNYIAEVHIKKYRKDMSEKQKIQLEYSINSSPKVLFNRLSTPAGLSEWFADDINIDANKIFTFVWEGYEQRAEVIAMKDQSYIKFRWLDEDEDENYFFEFRIMIDELTGDLALLITDFVEKDEIEDITKLWDTQILELKHTIGS
jgi:uncharacterized protein YndB with AHSA1/START domain